MTPQERVRELPKTERRFNWARTFPPTELVVPLWVARSDIADLTTKLDAAEAKLEAARVAIESAPQREVEGLSWLVRQIVDSLPTRRDWLDPDIEKMARAAIATILKPTQP